MIRFFLVLGLAFAAAAEIKVGQPAPEISVDVLLPEQPAGNASLRALQGKAVVLEFWATWCGPCVAGIPRMNELAAQFQGQVVFLWITEEKRAPIEAFLKKRPIDGLVAVGENHAVVEAYGVKGFGHTFLIDAAGKVAADLAGERLTAEMLNDLVAKRPITVPKAVPFSSTIRQMDDNFSRPVLDVIIRPTVSVERMGGIGRGNGELMLKAATVRGMLIALYAIPPNRIEGTVTEDNTRYDVWIGLPGATREAVNQAGRDAICTAFRLSARKEARETDVYLLTAPNGRPPGLVEAAPIGGILSGSGKGSLKVSGPLQVLASVLGNALGKPVVDETGIREAFDIRLTYEEGVARSMEQAVEKLGLKLEAARRPIEYLVVTKAQ